MRIAQLGVAALLLAAGAGCASMSRNATRPTASLTGMNVGGVTAEGFLMNFLVDVKNPIGVTLPVDAADYELGLAGVKLVSDKTKFGKGLAANSTTGLTMPVMVRFEDLLKAEREIVKTGGDVPYALNGTMNFRDDSMMPWQTVKVPVGYSGVLPLRQLLNDPRVVMQSPAARKLAQELVAGWVGK